LLGHKVSDIHPDTGKRAHIIVRINRPRSYDFNPPHKDVYEHWDAKSHVTPFVNFWVPIAGVGKESALPVVPGSHLLNEDKLLRTVEGGVVAGRKYHVRSVVSWDGRNDLTRVTIEDGEVLVFTPYLVHGCALNGQDDKTRVALEFRLYAV
jgi:ectoine hydroxylase-related dioxygenase (phytanoyl-CoA dioxygenase family)